MEEQIEVMRQSLGLIDTVLEGLTHIVKQLEEGLTSEAVQLISDINLASASLENSLSGLLTELDSTGLTLNQMEEVKLSLEQVTFLFEGQNFDQVRVQIQDKLIPRVDNLNDLLKKVFQPFLVS
ncbi:hypothetical protein [Evansella clarkii]|uniref:hypothetical protein n=1 Tax=Evansella clarkii TaxID=79879 RepID=UPI000998296C|nr:hypothetical protein [Evansella clarkii]